MEEIWKEHYNFENYEFSNYGRYRKSNTKFILKQSVSIDKHKNRKDGYVKTMLKNKHTQIRQSIRIHRIVAELFVKNDDPINKVTVNHIDGNKINNHYTNLEWMSVADNNRHAHITGLSDNAKKLNKENVIIIRNLFINTDISINELAKTYDVNNETIKSLLLYKTWWFVNEDIKEDIICKVQKKIIANIEKNKINPSNITAILNDYINGNSVTELSIKYNETFYNVKKLVTSSKLPSIEIKPNEIFIDFNGYKFSNMGRIVYKNTLVNKYYFRFNNEKFSLPKIIAILFVENPSNFKHAKIIDESLPLTDKNVMWVYPYIYIPNEEIKNEIIKKYVDSELTRIQIQIKYGVSKKVITKILKGIPINQSTKIKPHLCKSCGTTNPENFQIKRKSICKKCVPKGISKYVKKGPRKPLCKICGTTNYDDFYQGSKGWCRKCNNAKKLTKKIPKKNF
ncbi:hypothetical protein CCP3SC1AL1_1390003 [Gammaproteobacteria bacterium]